jgi:tRNA nucleotidyltransferase (CCA-adding enzyme)
MRLQLAGHLPREHLMVLVSVARLANLQGVPAYLVGGPVRDLLLGLTALDLDFAVEGDVLTLATALAQAEGGQLAYHERFATAAIVLPSGLEVDLAATRREHYPQPGALPEVEPATLADDLARRDFTCNAMAMSLDHDWALLHDPLGGEEDLLRRQLCGLHGQTFRDDPTRLLRAARYAARLHCQLSPATGLWLVQAVRDEALSSVSGHRIWGEMYRLLNEGAWLKACSLLTDWGLLPALDFGPRPPLELLGELEVCDVVLGLYGLTDDRALAALGLLAGERISAVAESWGLTASQRHSAQAAAHIVAEPPATCFADEPRVGALYDALIDVPISGLMALWAAFPQTRANLASFWNIRDVEADITGDMLRDCGCQPGPACGAALHAALTAKLEELADPQVQLERALATYQSLQVTSEPADG